MRQFNSQIIEVSCPYCKKTYSYSSMKPRNQICPFCLSTWEIILLHKYASTTLDSPAIKALTDLEDIIGESIPKIDVDAEDFGFAIVGNKIISLNVLNKKIMNLPASVGNISTLQNLNLSENYLSFLPETIGNLSNLIHLNLSHNKFLVLPENLGFLTNLKKINLSFNKLTTIPKSFQNLTKLEYLDLRDNNISYLPEYFQGFKSIKFLWLGENDIEYSINTISALLKIGCQIWF